MTIKIKVNGADIELSAKDAKELHAKLDKVFGREKEVKYVYIPQYINSPLTRPQPFNQPWQPYYGPTCQMPQGLATQQSGQFTTAK